MWVVSALEGLTGLFPLRRFSQKAPRTRPRSARKPNVNPTASGTTFNFGAAASVLAEICVLVEIVVVEGRADVAPPRRMLCAQRGRSNERKRVKCCKFTASVH